MGSDHRRSSHRSPRRAPMVEGAGPVEAVSDAPAFGATTMPFLIIAAIAAGILLAAVAAATAEPGGLSAGTVLFDPAA